MYEGSKNRSTPLGKGRPASDRVLSLEKYQFNRKKRVKDNSSFSAFQLAAAPIRSIQRRCCLVVYLSGNLGRTPGYLSRKYLQATVQKPNLVCGRLILSYYIPSVDSSGLDPLLHSLSPLSTLFRAHFLLCLPFLLPHPSSSVRPHLLSLLSTIPVNCPKLFDRPWETRFSRPL